MPGGVIFRKRRIKIRGSNRSRGRTSRYINWEFEFANNRERLLRGVVADTYLKHGEQALPKAVKIVTLLLLHVAEIELPTEDLFKGIKFRGMSD